MTRLTTIDAHVAGEPVRLVVGGGPSVPGRTMPAKLAWLRRHAEDLRKLLMLEPRGHAGMHGALLTEPVSPGSHAGILSMHAGGFPPLSGESIIAAATIALEHKLLVLNQDREDELLFDTPAGPVRARPRYVAASGAGGADAASTVTVASVEITAVPSQVRSAGISVRVGTRTVPVDVAFAGELYAIVDSEGLGVPVDLEHAQQLIQTARQLAEAIDGVQGTIFTAPPRTAADLRSATVLEGGILRRSPGVTGTGALMAVLDAMGLLVGDRRFVHEGVLGTELSGRIVRRQPDSVPSIVSAIEGSASITGFHEFVVQDRDYLSSAAAM